MDGFEWDPDKDRVNREKHRLSFEEAAEIFKGHTLTVPDDSADEPREISIGLIHGMVPVVVVHTDRDGKSRIISARRANANERKRFDAYLQRTFS